MLDSETKSRIDSARDILVGKVPDPKSQVEQITIALIYKFMDDMDRQSEELGGKATFFSGEYKKYAWSRLLDNRFGGHERLGLYAEGLDRMNLNKNIPQLFRDIFKGVFLPYRDPETLNLFLKEINGFSYDHSERLGDAFEYLLSVMDSQGSAGQFRTPRHIIDFIVRIVDPKKTETILDPACGTAGFLISSYKHILAQHQNISNLDNRSAESGIANQKSSIKNRKFSSELTPDERGRLMTNFCGYDISPDMVRLSRVNLYLHGFANPRIHEYDTLTSEERWDERYDVILANPPFMTPKGGIRPHNRFSIKAKRSEVLFVDYIAEHLNVNGRAGIIVPEGIIFQSQNAYKKLRKMLVENYLWCVVSLPAGCFNPYSGVKTSILLLNKSLAKRTDEILFVKVENDGFDLGAQRRPNGKNDLPEALSAISDFRLRISDLKKEVSDTQKSIPTLTVKKARLLESGDVNLSGDRYRDSGIRVSTKWPMLRLGEVCLINPPKKEVIDLDSSLEVSFVPMSDLNEGQPNFELKQTRPLKEVIKGYTYFRNEDVLLGKITPCFENGKAGIARQLKNGIGFGSTEFIVLRSDKKKIFPELIYHYISSSTFLRKGEVQMTGSAGQQRVVVSFVENYKIPVPPLEVQEKIVAELDGYRKIIEGAKQIIANYKPTIKTDPNWLNIAVGDLLEEVKYTEKVQKSQFLPDGRYPIIDQSEEFIAGYWNDENALFHITKPVVLFGDHTRAFKYVDFDFILGADGVKILQMRDSAVPKYFYYALLNAEIPNLGYSRHFKELVRVMLPLPPIDIQRRIVEEIDAERQLVEANRKLIEIFEKKIQEKLAEIWGEPDDAE